MNKLLLALFAVFVIIQFIPANLPVVVKENKDDLMATTDVPPDIARQLKTSCYDCHSNETSYPWYSYVAPVSFLVSRDTREGRRKLNFSIWNNLSKVKKAKYLDNINDEVSEGEMPMQIYTYLHSGSKLSQKEREAIAQWADNYAESLFGD